MLMIENPEKSKIVKFCRSNLGLASSATRLSLFLSFSVLLCLSLSLYLSLSLSPSLSLSISLCACYCTSYGFFRNTCITAVLVNTEVCI